MKVKTILISIFPNKKLALNQKKIKSKKNTGNFGYPYYKRIRVKIYFVNHYLLILIMIAEQNRRTVGS
jgi:hypothetical protein